MPCSSLEGRSIREVKKTNKKKTPWWHGPKGVYEIFLSKFFKALGGTSVLLVNIFKKEDQRLCSSHREIVLFGHLDKVYTKV